MAVVEESYNAKIDKNQDFVLDWEFTGDDQITPIDVSTWIFQFLLKDSNGSTVWNLQNGDFTRPSASRISFTKTIAQIASLSGIYSFSLLVTKTGVLNDEYANGYFQF